MLEPPAHALMDAVLCYVDGERAWFTTRDLARQSGEGWHKVPYEHNAGPPHPPRDGEEGEILCVGFEDYALGGSHLQAPCYGQINSSWSVQAINEGRVPWLRSTGDHPDIFAGTTLRDFIRLLVGQGHEVFLPLSRFHAGRVPGPDTLRVFFQSSDPEVRRAALGLLATQG